MISKTRNPASAPRVVRCAIYTRKSTEEGLDQDFNSLDAQRESAEAYIKSQMHEGWECVPVRYDDGGFTGGNMDRPALRRLMADIESGKVGCVVVYKVDRLSRSLLDFARMMETFEKYKVSFVSVTQQFNTASSMGRLVLNVLLSFAQFEREIISERTRDKIAAARRKGKWSGGHPILGYDVNERSKLIVNDGEAQRVRAIFDLYLEHQAMLPVVQELARRGWRNKAWTTRKGTSRGGTEITKTSLHKLLTNVAYAGKIRYKTETHAGEHEAIIDSSVWQRVQTTLERNGRTGGALVRNKFGALLKGIVRCVPCDCAMTPAHTTKAGKRYRYYTCSAAQKRGWHTCPSKSIPAGQIEQFVVDQLKVIGADPTLLAKTFEESQKQQASRIRELQVERRALDSERKQWQAEITSLVTGSSPNLGRLAELNERIRTAERRLTELNEEIIGLTSGLVTEDEVRCALSAFDPIWESLSPKEQARIIALLVARVDFDGAESKINITFHATGIKELASELETMEPA